MFPSRLARTLVESNDLREVCWVRIASKYEKLPQDQWGFVSQGSRGFVNEMCLKARGTDHVAHIAV